MSNSTQWCKHYHGMHGKTECSAGVQFASLKPMKHDQCPCWDAANRERCAKAEYPNAEESAAINANFARLFLRVDTAKAAILAVIGRWKREMGGCQGQIECPVCKTGQLRYSRSAYNGHVKAACETGDCVKWME